MLEGSLFSPTVFPYCQLVKILWRGGGLEPCTCGACTGSAAARPRCLPPRRNVPAQQPHRAETPLELLAGSLITPNELFYVSGWRLLVCCLAAAC